MEDRGQALVSFLGHLPTLIFETECLTYTWGLLTAASPTPQLGKYKHTLLQADLFGNATRVLMLALQATDWAASQAPFPNQFYVSSSTYLSETLLQLALLVGHIRTRLSSSYKFFLDNNYLRDCWRFYLLSLFFFLQFSAFEMLKKYLQWIIRCYLQTLSPL